MASHSLDKNPATKINLPWYHFWKHRRYVVTILAFFGFFNVFSLRVNLSTGIVSMTQNGTEIIVNGTRIIPAPEFDWDNKLQGYILSSFYYGYITTQFIGGYFAGKFGGKIIFGTGIGITAALTLLNPVLAQTSPYLFIGARIVEGFFEGASYPSLHAIWSKWAPPAERSRLTTIAYSGSYFGIVVSMSLYAYVASIWGWRSIFYLSGGLGLLWYLLWMLIVSNSPEQDSNISRSELQYIQESLKDESGPAVTKTVPWKAIITSKAVWSIVVTNFSELWGFYTLVTLLPKYFKDVYQFDLGKSGFLASLPYLTMAVMMNVSGYLADWSITRNVLSVTQVRKGYHFFGFVLQCAFMMGTSFFSNRVAAVFCLCMAVGLGAFPVSAFSVNSLDIAPQFASTLFGISNTFGTMPGIISPILAGYIVSDHPTVEEWRTVFYIAVGIYLFGAIFGAICTSGNIQSWAVTEDEKNEKRDEENKTSVSNIHS